MKFNEIVFLEIKEENLEPRFWERIDRICGSRRFLDINGQNLEKDMASADCLCTKGFARKIDRNIMASAPNLRYIGLLATGYGKIDTEYAASRGIAVTNVPGYSTNAVAELLFAVILERLRDLCRAKRQAASGDYSESSFFNTSEIRGRKFGIIGLGRIGQRVAEIALGFGAEVFYWSRSRKKEIEIEGAKYADLEILVSSCDFIALHLALNKETQNILNGSLIQKIKPGAIIVNLAPNELVDLEALKRRLERGDITYILDHSDELSPEQAKKLSYYENCIFYPPIGYTTREASAAKQEIFVSNMENFLEGSPTNQINKTVETL